MDRVFPIGFPGATAFYLILYVVTLCVHLLFMHYVIAGSGYLAFRAIRASERGERSDRLISATIRDWLPFGLGAAITAGVAPLLFVQVLYPESFYSANLLLLHRWMAILPVLIIGFYLLYLQKLPEDKLRSPVIRRIIPAIALMCFLFVAWSWTTNHSLSLARSQWPAFYEMNRLNYAPTSLFPRLATWLTAAIPTTCGIVMWQIRGSAVDADATAATVRRIASWGMAGVAAVSASAVSYFLLSDDLTREACMSPAALPYLIVAAAGLVVQFGLWMQIRVRPHRIGPRPVVALAGWLITMLGLVVVREVIRLAHVGEALRTAAHGDAAGVGGRAVFAACLVVNGLAIAWCIRAVRRSAA